MRPTLAVTKYLRNDYHCGRGFLLPMWLSHHMTIFTPTIKSHDIEMANVNTLLNVLLLCFGACLAISPRGCVPSGARSFTIDYTNGTFVKDGCPFHYVSGSIHYNRVPPEYWTDRLHKMAAAGLDAVQLYVPWNFHEKSPGVYDFTGQRNLTAFIHTAQQEGLDVIVRAGPYICGEWDFGGLPAWLLAKNGSVVVRTMDPGYLGPVDRWLNVLLPKLKPLLYASGGPIIMVQVENEYGSYFACDHGYMDHLAKAFRSYLGPDVVLFTTDGDGEGYLRCGAHPDLFTTVDFGPSANVSKNFDVLRKAQPGGPLVNSEFYTGWLDYWGHPHAHGSTPAIVNSLKQMLDLKASVSMYMFEGGTNFGFTNGADPIFNICPTSYDYDAPLTEAGDTTDKFMAIRSLIMQYKNVSRPVPANTTKKAYGSVNMMRLGSVLDVASDYTMRSSKSMYPLTMEQLGQAEGFILYQTMLTRNYPGDTLNASSVRDRAHIFVDGELRGIIDRNVQTTMTLVAAKGQHLQLFVENQGHINFGTQINHGSKGLLGNVTLAGDILTGWWMLPVDFSKMTHKSELWKMKQRMLKLDQFESSELPGGYVGTFQLPQTDKTTYDTFLNMTGWFKGQAYINGFNLGRYWPVRGPQVTLYVPAPILKVYPNWNYIFMLELDHSPCASRSKTWQKSSRIMFNTGQCAVTFVENAQLAGAYEPFHDSLGHVKSRLSRGPGKPVNLE